MPNAEEGKKRSRDKVEVETRGAQNNESKRASAEEKRERVLKVCAVAKNLMAETKDQGSSRIRWRKKKKKKISR